MNFLVILNFHYSLVIEYLHLNCCFSAFSLFLANICCFYNEDYFHCHRFWEGSAMMKKGRSQQSKVAKASAKCNLKTGSIGVRNSPKRTNKLDHKARGDAFLFWFHSFIPLNALGLNLLFSWTWGHYIQFHRNVQLPLSCSFV